MKLLNIALTVALSSLFVQPLLAADVKKSKSGICHDTSSSSYERTKNFTPFPTLDKCIASGGRLPKGHTSKPEQVADGSYKREYFGHGWSDFDKDCQNTRQEILVSMSTNPVYFSDDKECRVTKGRWISMFTGDIITDASKIDIDHVVPLKWAWDHGADKWSKEKREQFANDPVNLIAVEASLNRQKGAKGLDEWLPPKNQGQYKARFKRVMKKYGL